MDYLTYNIKYCFIKTFTSCLHKWKSCIYINARGYQVNYISYCGSLSKVKKKPTVLGQ